MHPRDVPEPQRLADRPGAIDRPRSAESGPHARTHDAGVGALIGLITTAVAIGTAQLVSGIVNPQASPILVVGQSAIDATPEWLKAFAIRTFGEQDKTVLLGGIGAVLLVVAVGLGIASIRRLWVGIAGLAAFGVLGVAAALTRPAAEPADALPTIAGAAAGVVALIVLRGAVHPAPSTADSPGVGRSTGVGSC